MDTEGNLTETSTAWMRGRGGRWSSARDFTAQYLYSWTLNKMIFYFFYDLERTRNWFLCSSSTFISHLLFSPCWSLSILILGNFGVNTVLSNIYFLESFIKYEHDLSTYCFKYPRDRVAFFQVNLGFSELACGDEHMSVMNDLIVFFIGLWDDCSLNNHLKQIETLVKAEVHECLLVV